jgi:hypothetical protein
MAQRIPNEVFLQTQWAVHDLLSAIPLLDVWRMDLRGGPNPAQVTDLRAVLETLEWSQMPALARQLFALRQRLGGWMGWDEDATQARLPAQSYVHRLEPSAISCSQVAPGTRYPPLTLVYQYEQEALAEAINATTHAFIHLSLQPARHFEGTQAYLAIYAQSPTWWSRYYMHLIEPFRQWVVYPALLDWVEQRWSQQYTPSATASG